LDNFIHRTVYFKLNQLITVSDHKRGKIVGFDDYLNSPHLPIVEFKDSPEKYAFSSLGIYIGKKRDRFDIVDYEFVMGFFGDKLKAARKNYYKRRSRDASSTFTA